MKKSAKILVIAALFVSAIVMTGCSNLLTKVTGKPSGTYVYKDQVWYITYIFDGDNAEYKLITDYNASGNFTGKPYDTDIKGTVKVSGLKATVTFKDSTIKEHELVSDDRWKSFSIMIDDTPIGPFTKK